MHGAPKGRSSGDGAVASIVIVTRDRRDDLRKALASVADQRGPLEVIVIDDGSSDGTPSMVEYEFPDVRLIRSPTPQGYIAQRNLGVRLASAPIVVSIDDDAEFSSADTVALTLALFGDARVAAVAMPLIHTERGPDVLQRAPGDDGTWVTNAYIGTAHAVRRDAFLAVGGYREEFEHFFEEPDLCLRLFRRGWVVALGRTPPILHHESPKRDQQRGVRYLFRNHVLFAWFHVPFPDAVARGAGIAVYAVWSGLRLRNVRAALEGLRLGAQQARRRRGDRRPIPVSQYRLWRRLRRRPRPLGELAARLPPPPPVGVAD